jgi:hypothetical protein
MDFGLISLSQCVLMGVLQWMRVCVCRADEQRYLAATEKDQQLKAKLAQIQENPRVGINPGPNSSSSQVEVDDIPK